jgi:hypothetical protein
MPSGSREERINAYTKTAEMPYDKGFTEKRV